MASEKSGFACALEHVGEVHIKIMKRRKMNEDTNAFFMFVSCRNKFIEYFAIQIGMNLSHTKQKGQMKI
jgi:hypothetical protein